VLYALTSEYVCRSDANLIPTHNYSHSNFMEYVECPECVQCALKTYFVWTPFETYEHHLMFVMLASWIQSWCVKMGHDYFLPCIYYGCYWARDTHHSDYYYCHFRTFKGLCIVNAFQIMTNKMQRYTIFLFLQTAPHVSGGSPPIIRSTILYLQHLVFVEPLLLSAPIVEERNKKTV
jgi:hypothetical protein